MLALQNCKRPAKFLNDGLNPETNWTYSTDSGLNHGLTRLDSIVDIFLQFAGRSHPANLTSR